MKTDQPRQYRIPFMLSETELASVDDWRFTNRVATRAEAIRRLIAIGLNVASSKDDAINHVQAALEEEGIIAGDRFAASFLNHPEIKRFHAQSAKSEEIDQNREVENNAD